ncbi:MAG: hypothetical protein ACRDYB_00610 [Acidimicrobiales bacterium]
MSLELVIFRVRAQVGVPQRAFGLTAAVVGLCGLTCGCDAGTSLLARRILHGDLGFLFACDEQLMIFVTSAASFPGRPVRRTRHRAAVPLTEAGMHTLPACGRARRAAPARSQQAFTHPATWQKEP